MNDRYDVMLPKSRVDRDKYNMENGIHPLGVLQYLPIFAVRKAI